MDTWSQGQVQTDHGDLFGMPGDRIDHYVEPAIYSMYDERQIIFCVIYYFVNCTEEVMVTRL